MKPEAKRGIWFPIEFANGHFATHGFSGDTRPDARPDEGEKVKLGYRAYRASKCRKPDPESLTWK